MLACDGRWYDKPADLAEARAQLLSLRGKTHELVSAVVLMRNGSAIWRHAETAKLTMRDFSDGFLDAYLAQAGDAVLQRSEEHTSELQSLLRISYAVFCWKKKTI